MVEVCCPAALFTYKLVKPSMRPMRGRPSGVSARTCTAGVMLLFCESSLTVSCGYSVRTDVSSDDNSERGYVKIVLPPTPPCTSSIDDDDSDAADRVRCACSCDCTCFSDSSSSPCRTDSACVCVAMSCVCDRGNVNEC